MPAAGEAATHLLERLPGSTFPTSVEPVTYTLPDGTNSKYLHYQAGKFPDFARTVRYRPMRHADARRCAIT